jgi:molybdate transport system ATP-binding protein
MSGFGLDVDLTSPIGGGELRAQLRVGAGEVAAIRGDNAAGKTTLLRALAGLHPLTGRVEVADRVLDDTRRGWQVPTERRGVGLVFQDTRLFAHLGVRDNVAFGLRRAGVGRRRAHSQAAEALAAAGLGPLTGLHPQDLSGGQARLVALLRTLVCRPPLLLLDEPTAGLDAQARASTCDLVRAHLASYQGVCLLVTHDERDLLELADATFTLQRTGDQSLLGAREPL